MKQNLRILALPSLLGVTMALASCGSSSTPNHNAEQTRGTTTSGPSVTSPPATAARNAADVTFATDMIPHHAQAVAMSEMAPTRAADVKVKTLAAKIKGAQDPEIARMSGWLTTWGAPVPDIAGGHDTSAMGGTSSGMMSAKEMADLGKATGSTFDRMWLQAMTRHHQGAVAMARTELTSGTNPEAEKLAQSIIDSQSTEITQMKAILSGVPR